MSEPEAGYPPQPWRLRGQLHASAFLVPRAELPLDPPPRFRPLLVGGRVVVGVAWVSYEPGGVLSYRELMATVLLRRGLLVVPTIVRIWVDSLASRDGGRALWAIPKRLASFEFRDGRFAAFDGDGAIASGTVAPRMRMPGRWPARFRVAQRRDGQALVTPVRLRAAFGLSRATLAPDPSGPLAFLAGRCPVLSFSVTGFDMRFGTRGGARARAGVQ